MTRKCSQTLVLAVAFCSLLLLSCNKESRWDCFKRTGKTASTLRVLPPFNKINLVDNIDVYITQGSNQEVKIETGKNLISLIKTEVDSGILFLRNDNKCNWARSYKNGTIKVYVTMPTLRFIWNYGSGLIKSNDTLFCDTLDIWAHQTGDIDLTVNSNIIYTNMHTTADITLKGKTQALGSWHVGEGYLHCENLEANIAWAHSYASGNEYLNVRDNLLATIDWEGNIYYKGSAVVEQKGVGIGELIKQN